MPIRSLFRMGLIVFTLAPVMAAGRGAFAQASSNSPSSSSLDGIGRDGGPNVAVSDGNAEQESVAGAAPAASKESQSELAFNGLSSFGHFHIFANSWWSNLSLASVEYDRHSWGRFAGARMDYAGEVEPMVLLWQPTKQTVWGTPQTKQRELLYGVGIAPIGLRMQWHSGRAVKPYLTSKGGMLFFDKKALSSASSYAQFSFQVGIGAQFRIAPRWDARTGFTYYHFSNGFMTPSNPGLDSMMYNVGLVYRFGGTGTSR